MKASIRPGWAGHDREMTVNIGTDWYGEEIDWATALAVEEALPESWMLENRGTRLEVHPTGSFAGGFTELDVLDLVTALRMLGYETKVIRPT